MSNFSRPNMRTYNFLINDRAVLAHIEELINSMSGYLYYSRDPGAADNDVNNIINNHQRFRLIELMVELSNPVTIVEHEDDLVGADDAILETEYIDMIINTLYDIFPSPFDDITLSLFISMTVDGGKQIARLRKQFMVDKECMGIKRYCTYNYIEMFANGD